MLSDEAELRMGHIMEDFWDDVAMQEAEGLEVSWVEGGANEEHSFLPEGEGAYAAEGPGGHPLRKAGQLTPRGPVSFLITVEVFGGAAERVV